MKKIIALIIGTVLSLHLKAMDQSKPHITVTEDAQTTSIDQEIDQFLAEHNCPTNRSWHQRYCWGSTTAASRECLAQLPQLLEKKFENKSQKEKKGLLKYAYGEADNGIQIALIEGAVRARAETNEWEHERCFNPLLQKAIEDNCLEFAELLLSCGANPNAVSGEHRTFLEPAKPENIERVLKEAHTKEMAQLLIKYGADPKIAGNIHRNPVHWAVYTENPSLLSLYLDSGVPIPKNILEEKFQVITEHTISSLAEYFELERTNAEEVNSLPIYDVNKFLKLYIDSNRPIIQLLLDHGVTIPLSFVQYLLKWAKSYELQCRIGHYKRIEKYIEVGSFCHITYSNQADAEITHSRNGQQSVVVLPNQQVNYIDEQSDKHQSGDLCICNKAYARFFQNYFYKQMIEDRESYLACIPNDLKNILFEFVHEAEYQDQEQEIKKVWNVWLQTPQIVFRGS